MSFTAAPLPPATEETSLSCGKQPEGRRHAFSGPPLVFALLLGLGVAAPVAGQPSAEPTKDDQSTLEQITVTARRFEENLQQVGSSVMALTAEDLTLNRVDTGDELPRLVPNLVMKKRSGSAGDGLATKIRGIGTSDIDTLTSDPSVGVYVDGVFQTRAFGPQFDLFDIERIEVLRGPQGTLYGKNSLAGAINVITAKPANAQSGKFSVEYGNFDAVMFSAAANFPLVEDKLLLRLSGAVRNRDGFTVNEFDGDDVNDQRSQSFRLAMRYLASDALTFDWNVDFLRQNQNQAPWFLVAVNPARNQPGSFLRQATALAGVADIDVFAKGMSPRARDLESITIEGGTGTGEIFPRGKAPLGGVSGNMGEHFNLYGGSFTVEWNLGERHVLKAITGLRGFDRVIRRDVDGTPVQILDQSQLTEGWTFTEEVQLNSTLLGGRLDLVTGLFWARDDLRGDAANPFLSALADEGVLNISPRRLQILDNHALAIFTHGNFHLSDRLSVSAGLRLNSENKKARIRGALLSNPEVFDQFDAAGDITFDSVQPKVGLDYALSDRVFTYAVVSKGYSSGGYNGRLAVGATEIPTFDEETLWNYEIGLKSDFLGNRARLNVAAFFMDYTNVVVQTFGVSPSGTIGFFLDNVGSAEVKGVEIEFLTRPLPALTLRASAGLLDREFKDVGVGANGQPLDPRNFQFFDSPDTTASLSGEYHFDLGDAGLLTLSANWSYQSEIFFDNDNALYSQQPAYDLLGARLAYSSADDKFGVSLWAENLTQTVYATRTLSVFNTIFGYAAARFGDPRTFGLTMTYRY